MLVERSGQALGPLEKTRALRDDAHQRHVFHNRNAKFREKATA